MKHKRILIILLLLMPVLISGCWDHVDVDELAIVVAVGIDQIPGPERILLTVQIVNPGSSKGPSSDSSGGQEKPFVVLTSQGKSFFEALRNLSKSSTLRLFLAHNRIVVLGKDFAASDISEVMDYMDRDREFRRTNRILVAEKTAKEVLETKIELQKIPAEAMYILLISRDQTQVYAINRSEFLLQLNSVSGVSYAPLIQLRDLSQESNVKLEQATGQPVKSSETKSSPKIHLEETAIFKDNRLIGKLNAEETKGLLWLINKLKGDTVVIPYTTAEGVREITLDIAKGKSKIIPHITDTEITMEIVCTGQANLRETESLNLDLRDLTIYKQLEQAAEEILKTRIEQTIVRAQTDLQADFPGFGNCIHNANPVEWNRLKTDWDQRFSELKYDINVDLTLVKMGKIKGSSIKDKGE